MEKFFKLEERGTNKKREMVAGITTFLSMAYILAVNPQILSGAGMDSGAVFTATCISAGIGTLIMAFLANYPVALASGMGLNAYFAYTVCPMVGTEHPWEVALAAILVEGIIFVLLSFTNFREKLVNEIPSNLKYGITVGIGLFVAIIGLKNSGAVTVTTEGGIALGDLASAGVTLSLVGVLIIAFMESKKIKGAILWGILITWVLGMLAELVGWYVPDPEAGVFSVMLNLDFSNVIPTAPYLFDFDFAWIGEHILEFAVIVFSFLYVDIFDTVGTLIGVAQRGNLLDEEGNLPRAKQALLSDAIGTIAGACLGTSTVTSYVESTAGVGAGGRTGLASVWTGGLFIVALFLSPIFLSIPSFATTPALIYVGFLMMKSVSNIHWSKHEADLGEVISAFLAIIMMPFTSSIANGIMFGIISYVVLKVAIGKIKEVPVVMWISAALFVLYMVVS
ncbi:MAG: NCS2 family permease [Clostridia bacterium]|nr:NCS2 family permease [Clostridia bacterium]